MADSDPTTHMLDVPGARLYYERRGSGPLLLLIGSPMDSGGFAPLASALADRYTVVTYDPRGIANSSSSCWLTPPGCGPRFRTSTTPTATGPTSRRYGRRRRGSWSPPGPPPKGQLPNRTAVALADQLGTTVSTFPATMADSWPSRSSSAASSTRC
jgi:pimeloyl-ACP methyl ester carboxylesterase